MGNPMSGPVTLTVLPVEKQIYAKTLLDMGVSLRRTAKRVGISPVTVIAIKRNQAYSPRILDEFKHRLPYKSYKLADDVIDLITPAEIAKAPLGTKMMAFGVAIDKARDMEGSNRPVFNVVTVINECKSTREKLEAQLSTIKTLRAVAEQKALNTPV